MDSGRVYDGSNMTVLLQNERLPCSSEVLDSLWISNSSPSFHGDTVSGSTSMVNFENSPGENAKGRPFFTPFVKEENGNEDYDGCFHQPEKKRRLTADQVRFLERNFEVENKLEPERKVQLAKELGLQPRQVAIWFQNRRARYKTKQLEKEYDSLKASCDKLKAGYDSLLKEKEKLENEVQLLTEELCTREKGGKGKSEPSDPIINPVNVEPQKRTPTAVSENESNIPMVACKQEDASSAKSDVFDSDSSHYTDGNHSSLLEPADSSHVSDFSQDEEADNLSRSLLRPICFPKLEEGSCYSTDPHANSCNLGCPVEDQALWFWSY